MGGRDEEGATGGRLWLQEENEMSAETAVQSVMHDSVIAHMAIAPRVPVRARSNTDDRRPRRPARRRRPCHSRSRISRDGHRGLRIYTRSRA